MKFETLERELLKDDEFRKECERTDDLPFEISEMIINARIEKGITQAELAKRIKTKQSSIARAENGNTLPSISFLQKIAKALDTTLTPPRFNFDKDKATGTERIENKIIGSKSTILNISCYYSCLVGSKDKQSRAKWYSEDVR